VKGAHPVAANESKKFFIGPDEGDHLPVLDMVHKVAAVRSGGSLTIEEWGLPPGQMIPPHTHSREDECNFVLEGEGIASKLASGEIDEDEHRRLRAELGERYGLTWHDERIPEARTRFGIGP
jgi:hypothetical protein